MHGSGGRFITPFWVVVRSEKRDSYQGMPSGMPAQCGLKPASVAGPW